MIPTLLLVTIVVFLMVRLIPGDAIQQMALEMGQTAAGEQLDFEAIKEMMGMNEPMHVQYGKWMWGIFTRFDFGNSLFTERPVINEIVSRIPVTFELGVLAFFISQVMAIPIGLYSAIRQDTVGDLLGRTFAILNLATPAFWLATMIMVFPSIWWGWSPPMRYTPFLEDPMANLRQFIIPAALMGTAMSATTMRMLRTTMLEVLRQDYVRTAWSKGLKERIVVVRHAMRNALIPVITMISGQVPIMIGGAVIMEQIFNLPGMGRLFLDAINRRDYPFVSGINVLLAAFGLVLILITDLTYAWLDPRVRYR